jgi:hypothetical protein
MVDRLRLWVEKEQSPEISMTFFLIHAIARLSIAFIWIWQGLVPKLIFRNADEQQMLVQAGLPLSLLPWIGAGEILIGVLVLCTWRIRAIFIANALAMVLASGVVLARSPYYLTAAFNAVTLNLGVFALALTGWLVSRTLPSASKCLRVNPRNQA